MLRISWFLARYYFATLGSACLAAAVCLGDGLPLADASADSLAKQIIAAIGQLDRPGFAERQAASQELEQAGAAAVPHLERAASEGSREVSGRALDILKRQYERGSDDVKQAAQESLARLSASNDASAAQRARDVLKPPQVSFAVPDQVGNVRRVGIGNINGHKVVEIEERDRKVKMDTAPGGAIEVEVIERFNRNFGAFPRKVSAKNLDDLKQKDPQIAKLYEQFQRPGLQPLGPGLPGLLPAGFGPAAAPRVPAADIAQVQIQTIDLMLQRFRQDAATNPSLQRIIDSLEQQKARYRGTLPGPRGVPLVR